MKFFIFPNYNTFFDFQMINGLGKAIKDEGHVVKCFNYPISDISLKKLVEINKPDVIIQINKFRPKNLENIDLRHISWFQDVFPSTNNKTPINNSKDIIYTLSSKKSLGLKILIILIYY